MENKTIDSFDEYISSFPKEVQLVLEKVRQTIKEAAPEASEAIKYRMPTFILNGKNLIHFAAFKNHLGLFPTPSGINEFKEELACYQSSKGGVQFPFNKPIPYSLIAKITKFRVREISANK